jgi:hypothetical protein
MTWQRHDGKSVSEHSANLRLVMISQYPQQTIPFVLDAADSGASFCKRTGLLRSMKTESGEEREERPTENVSLTLSCFVVSIMSTRRIQVRQACGNLMHNTQYSPTTVPLSCYRGMF